MLKPLITAFITLFMVGATACSQSETATNPDPRPYSEVLASEGLAAAAANLKTQTSTAETSFLLGGVQFLRSVETIMQVRYANNAGSLALVPGMRNQLPGNPDGKFNPDFLERAMTGALQHLGEAEASLGKAVSGEFSTSVNLDAIWFDINDNGQREDWESLLAVMGTLNAAPGETFDGTIKFDTADAEWLKAYVHLMSGMSELVLAADPTPAITTVWDGRQGLEEFGIPQGIGFVGDDTLPDMLASVLLTLRGVPDRTRTRAALSHFKSMISHNRAFWSEVVTETDNDHEWLPNAAQASAFGVTIDEATIEGWQDVLAEISSILEGETLVPYWRVGQARSGSSGIGVNIEKFLNEPGDMDLILWIQGSAAVPYLERGDLADMAAWRRFTRMTRGDSLMFAVWFN